MFNKDKNTFELQHELGMFCRNGEQEPTTSIQENTFHYRRLIYNIVDGALRKAYPMTVELLEKEEWKAMVTHFFANHACHTPQVWMLPYELYTYYSNNPLPFENKHPFLLELLLFEWLEIEVYTMEDETPPSFIKYGDIEKDILIPNPEIKIQPLEYPVHLKKINNVKPEDKGHYFVSIHRDYDSKRVMFNDLSYPQLEMIVHVNEQSSTFNHLVKLLSKYEQNEEVLKREVAAFINMSLQKGIILGFKA